MDANGKRYVKEFGTAMLGYILLVPVSILLLKGNESSLLRFVYAALPVVPAAVAMWAAIRFYRGLDELQRRIHLEALAFSFLATCLITLTYGFLENAGFPQLGWIWIAPMLIGFWGLGRAFASQRYR